MSTVLASMYVVWNWFWSHKINNRGVIIKEYVFSLSNKCFWILWILWWSACLSVTKSLIHQKSWAADCQGICVITDSSWHSVFILDVQPWEDILAIWWYHISPCNACDQYSPISSDCKSKYLWHKTYGIICKCAYSWLDAYIWRGDINV